MRRMRLPNAMRGLLAAAVAATALQAQSIEVYSEFRRVDPFGEIVPQDRGGEPREILSPLVARNSHLSIHIVVRTPPGKHYYLFVGSNPEDIFDITVYKEMWRKQGSTWAPDRLLRVETPYLSHIPDRYHGLNSQRVEVFFLDVYVPADLKPGRYKLEPQVSCDGRWAIYPMEVRVSDVVVPEHRYVPARLPSTKLPSDAAALGPLRAYLCGEAERHRDGTESIRALIRRNVLEDIALAREKEKTLGKEAVARILLRGLNIGSDAFCALKKITSEYGPEWYLRARDVLYRGERKFY